MARWLLATSVAACAQAPSAERDGAAVPTQRFVLLGEVHDNALHHDARAALLRALLADGRPTRVVFEQMDTRHDAAIAAAARDADAVADAGQLDRRAWRWPMHKPLFDVALAGGATIAGANVSRDTLRAVMKNGLDAAPAPLRDRVAGTPWSPDQQASLEGLIDRGHCGLLPASQHAPMALAQRVRDASMAQAMLQAAPGERVVLIAGNGHVRADLGVPVYLRAAGVPAREIAAIGYVEAGEAAPPFDRVVVTPPAQRDDPCAAMKTTTPR